MIQEILVAFIFIIALIYAGWSFWRQTRSTSSGCSTSCGCEVSDTLQKLKKS